MIILIITLLLSFSLQAKVYFSPQDNLAQVVTKELNKATQTIDLSIYTFSSRTIRSKLIEKLDAGVSVRVIIHQGNKASVKAFIDPLIVHGARVKYVTKINHHKFIIIDSKTLYNSSGNMSDSSRQASYDENSFVCSDDCKSLVESYRNEFQFIFDHAISLNLDDEDSEQVTPYRKELEVDAFFTTTNFTTKYSRGRIQFKLDPSSESGNVATRMAQAIDNAKKSIQIATGHFRSWPLFQALKRAVQRGVKVELMLDSQEYVSKSKHTSERRKVKKCIKSGKSEQLCSKTGVHFSRAADQAGIVTRIKYYAIRWFFPKAPQMHSKYMIIDGEDLYTGSYNWSYNAEFSTFENVAHIKDKQMIKKYQDNFKQLFEMRVDLLPSMMRSTYAETKKLPLFFPPLALTVGQIDKILYIYRKKCRSLYKEHQGSPYCKVTKK